MIINQCHPCAEKCVNRDMDCTKQCTPSDRKRAESVSQRIANDINHMSTNLIGSINDFVSNFAEGGVYSTSINPTNPPYYTKSNFYGHTAITNFLITRYGPSSPDQNVSVVIRKTYWDCVTRTLGVERTWFATNVMADRIFAFPNFGNPAVILQPGNNYSQDQFVCFQFDCDFKLVFYREYYDSSQFISTYTDNYPPVCDIKCQDLKCDIKPCTNCDRDRVTQIINTTSYAFELGGTTPFDQPTDQYLATLGAKIFTALFANNGVWVTDNNPTSYPPIPPLPQSAFVGLAQILAFTLSYTTAPQETNQILTIQQLHWDCETRTVMLQIHWIATIQEGFTRTFANGTVLSGGQSYTQDNFHTVRFDCNYKIVYYNEYFDHNQYQSTYPPLIQPVCSSTTNCIIQDKNESNTKACHNKSCDNKSCDNKSCDNNSGDNNSGDNKSCHNKSCDNKSCHNKEGHNKSCHKNECHNKERYDKECRKTQGFSKGYDKECHKCDHSENEYRKNEQVRKESHKDSFRKSKDNGCRKCGHHDI